MKPIGAQPSGEAAVPLKRLIGYGLVGQLTFVVSQFGLLLALSRLGTVEDVGRYGLASAIATPIFLMFSFGFRVNQATDLAGRHSFREFAALRSISSALSYGLVAIIAATLVDRATALVLVIFAASRAAENRSTLIYGLLQKYDQMRLVARSLVLRGVGGAGGFALALWLSRSPLVAYGALFLVWTAVALAHDQRAANRLTRGSDEDRPATRAGLVDILRTSWPIAINSLLGGAQASVPRFAINALLGLGALGKFTLVAYAMQAINTVVMAIAQSMLARLALYRLKGETKRFFRTLHTIIAVLFAGGLVAALVALAVGDPLLLLVFGPKYSGLGSLLALCLVTATVSAAVTILQTGLTSARRFIANMWIRLAGVAIVAGGSYAGAALAGLHGVFAGMIAAFAGQMVLLYALLRRSPDQGEAGETEPRVQA